MTMRIRIAKFITVFVIVLNFVAIYLIWKLLSSRGKIKIDSDNEIGSLHSPWTSDPRNRKTITNQVTFVIRSFEAFDNDIADTVSSVLSLYPSFNILVISDTFLYPPITLNASDVNMVKFVDLQFSLVKSFEDKNPTVLIKTKYTFFIPDASRLCSRQLITSLISKSIERPQDLIAVPFKDVDEVKCLRTHIDPREWFIRFDEIPQSIECDFIKGKHGLFLVTNSLLTMLDPLMLPFPESLYIQAASKNIKVIVSEERLHSGKELFKSQHNQWKLQQAYRERQKSMFYKLEMKRVVRETGATEWFGCRRDTPRCFGSIVDETPQYLWEGKWTPPCCLANLRRTARHVFTQLEEARVRYWLEGGSLLGAMRSGDILPWDYDVDLGIYREDITKCTWLLRALEKPVTDPQGFVWERAVEGDFFRVQYSHINRLHVDIFPFYPRNGTMTKDTWFKTHPQDREFPEFYLKPLSSIEFLGRSVSAPNNIHDFLELKFGEGAIENPEYPNPYKMAVHGMPRGPLNR